MLHRLYRWQRHLAVNYLKSRSVFRTPRETGVKASAVEKAYNTGMNQLNSHAALMPTYTDFDDKLSKDKDFKGLARTLRRERP